MIEELKQRLVQKPFVPFCIVLKDGRRFEVARLGQVAVGLTKFTVVKDGDFVHLSEEQIKELEVPGATEATR